MKLTETEPDLWPLDWFELTLWDLCYFLEFGRIESEIWGGLRFGVVFGLVFRGEIGLETMVSTLMPSFLVDFRFI